MVRKLFALMLGVALLGVTSYVAAEDKKDEKKKAEKVTLEGKLVCTKCELKETKACAHAFLVTDEKTKKEVKYYLADKGAKEKYHGECCQAPADAKVTGTVVEKKEKDVVKLTITDPKVEIKK